MSTAHWLFARNIGTGTDADPHRPANMDIAGGRSTVPGDIVRLTGPSGNDHRHLLIGGIALPDDNLSGQTGDGHMHYVVRHDGNLVQVTVGAANHTHDLNLDANGNLAPEWYLVFWTGSDADAATIANHADCFPFVEAPVTTDGDGNQVIGDLADGWYEADTATWHARMLSILGITLPSEVTNGRRLVTVMLGALLSRQAADERGYRMTS